MGAPQRGLLGAGAGPRGRGGRASGLGARGGGAGGAGGRFLRAAHLVLTAGLLAVAGRQALEDPALAWFWGCGAAGACPGACAGRGTCVEGSCVCGPGFVGPDCVQRECPGGCGGRGQCMGGYCVCGALHGGPGCEVDKLSAWAPLMLEGFDLNGLLTHEDPAHRLNFSDHPGTQGLEAARAGVTATAGTPLAVANAGASGAASKGQSRAQGEEEEEEEGRAEEPVDEWAGKGEAKAGEQREGEGGGGEGGEGAAARIQPGRALHGRQEDLCLFMSKEDARMFGGNKFEYFSFDGIGLSLEVTQELYDLLPEKCPEIRHDSCLLLGNSGTLMLEKRGEYFDSHDMVYRFNQGPTEKYEAHVGRKTTYESLNAKFANKLLADEGWNWRNPDVPTYIMFEPIKLASLYVDLRRKYPDVKILLLTPDAYVRIHRVYNDLLSRLEQYELGCFVGEKPMSGFYAMIFASAFCGGVAMAGFDPWTESMRNHSVRYHYFDDEEPRPGAHSFDATYYMYQLLEKSSHLNISILELGQGQT